MAENQIPTTAEGFQSLWKAHNEVGQLSVPEVGSYLGGKVEVNITSGTFENGCAIRLSHAFNEATDEDIPKIPYIKGEVSSDAEKDWHIYRYDEFKTFMNDNFGPPTIVSNNEADFYGQQGIIAFNVNEWDNATGHIDVYNGDACGTGCYFDKSESVEMWIYDQPEPVEVSYGDSLQYGFPLELKPEDFPMLEHQEAGLPIYDMDNNGNFSADPLGNIYQNSFENDSVQIMPVYDADTNLFAFFVTEDPQAEEGFYVHVHDVPEHVMEQYLETMKAPEIQSTISPLPQLSPNIDIAPQVNIETAPTMPQTAPPSLQSMAL